MRAVRTASLIVVSFFMHTLWFGPFDIGGVVQAQATPKSIESIDTDIKNRKNNWTVGILTHDRLDRLLREFLR
jgi:hypothetical protein